MHRLRVAVALIALVACADSPFGPAPESLAEVPPYLTVVEVEADALERGLFAISALLDHTLSALVEGEYAEIRVRSDAGEDEVLRLRPAVCPGDEYCRRLVLFVEEDVAVSEYTDAVRARGGVMTNASDGLRIGLVRAVDDPAVVMRRLRNVPGVSGVVRDVAVTLQFPGEPGESAPVETVPLSAYLGAEAFFVWAPAVASDGIVSGVAGDSITIEYLQPGESVPQTWSVVLD